MFTSWQALALSLVLLLNLVSRAASFALRTSPAWQQTAHRHSNYAAPVRMAAAAPDFRKPPTGLGSWQLRFDVEGDQCSMFVILFDDGTGILLTFSFARLDCAIIIAKCHYTMVVLHEQLRDPMSCYTSHDMRCILCRRITCENSRFCVNQHSAHSA
jgi:hypothetical protein